MQETAYESANMEDGTEARVQIFYHGVPLGRFSLTDEGCSSDVDDGRRTQQLVRLKMPGELFDVVHREWNLSPAFRRRIIEALAAKSRVPFFAVNIRFTSLPPYTIDHDWCYRISQLVLVKLELEKLLWIFNSYGGAFSAMGEYSISFADRAARTSVEQLRIALQLGDPVLVARCKLYFALSLAQHGRLREASVIVREQHKRAMELRSELLRRCCLGIWTKLRQTVAARRRTTRSTASDCSQFTTCPRSLMNEKE